MYIYIYICLQYLLIFYKIVGKKSYIHFVKSHFVGSINTILWSFTSNTLSDILHHIMKDKNLYLDEKKII